MLTYQKKKGANVWYMVGHAGDWRKMASFSFKLEIPGASLLNRIHRLKSHSPLIGFGRKGPGGPGHGVFVFMRMFTYYSNLELLYTSVNRGPYFSFCVRTPKSSFTCAFVTTFSFQKRYSFLYESELPAEKEDLKKLMKKSNDPEVISGLKDRLSWIDKQLKSVKTKRSDKEILAEHKKKEREAAKQGKQPYYLKKSEIKKQTLIEKYKDLKASGKLESFLEKRRKKSAAKDRRFMPYRRSNDE